MTQNRIGFGAGASGVLSSIKTDLKPMGYFRYLSDDNNDEGNGAESTPPKPNPKPKPSKEGTPPPKPAPKPRGTKGTK